MAVEDQSRLGERFGEGFVARKGRVEIALDQLGAWGGTAFRWTDAQGQPMNGTTVWNVFEGDSTYFAPSTAPFMINYRVDDLHALLKVLREEGCAVEDKVEESDYGKFGWVVDLEGNKVELWQPPAGF